MELTSAQLEEVRQLPNGKLKVGDHIQSDDFNPKATDQHSYLTSVIKDIVMFNGYYAYKVVAIKHSIYEDENVLGHEFHVPVHCNHEWENRITEIDYDLSEVPEGFDQEYLDARQEGYDHEDAVASAVDSYEMNCEEPPEEDPDPSPPEGWGYDNGFGWA